MIPPSWKIEGRRQSLAAGQYGWYVWAVVSGRRQSEAVVQTKLEISG